MTRLVGIALIIYVAALSLLGLWLDRQLSSSVDEVASRFAEVVGREVALSLGPELGDSRMLDLPSMRQRLEHRIAVLDRRSELLGSLVLVGDEGQVLAASEPSLHGQHRTPPADLFEGHEPAEPVASSVGRPGVVFLRVPLGASTPPNAYLELTLRSSTLAAAYERGARRLMVATGIGMGLLLLGGVALVKVVSRRDRSLAAAVEQALEGRSPQLQDASEEFSVALRTAGKLGAELVEQRHRSTLSQHVINQLSSLTDIGLVALSADGDVELINEPARRLLGGNEGVEGQLRSLLTQLAEPLGALVGGEASLGRDLTVETAERELQVRCELVSVPCEDSHTVVIVLRDLEALHALEADLRDATQLRGLAVLYLGMAHDLKAPLNAMALHIELLQRSLGSNGQEPGTTTDEQRREWLTVLRQEVDRLTRGLDTMVAQSALPRQGRAHFDLRSVMAEVAALLSLQAQQQGVTLAADGGDEPLWVDANADQLKQAVLNLSINALEAQPEGGSLNLVGALEGDRVVVRVADSGPGIPPERLGRVFELRFSGRKGGLGVGLYVARSIVTSQGGSLEVAETGPAGTVFRLALPRSSGPPAAQEA